MKKTIQIFTFILMVFIITGFRGCFFSQQQPEPVEHINYNEFNNVGFYNSDNLLASAVIGIAVGKDGIILSSRGGSSAQWYAMNSPTNKDLHFVKSYTTLDTNIVVAVGDSGAVIFDTDTLNMWVDKSIPSLNKNLYGFDFISDDPQNIKVVVCGDDGLVYKSSNIGGSVSWQALNTITTKKLRSISVLTAFIFIAVGDSGTIIRTSDGGITWENKSTGSVNFNRICEGYEVGSPATFWIAGNNGKIYKSTNYGSGFFSVNSGTSNDLYDIKFRNSTEGIAVGREGVIRLTSDGGITWYSDSFLSALTNLDIITVSLVDSNTVNGIVVNNFNGDRLNADTTYMMSVSTEPLTNLGEQSSTVPREFILYQNYPNPFNPTTKIRYTIPSNISTKGKNFNTKLIVYDVLGNEIVTLVDEYKTAGSYEVDFKQRDISTGIYFYKLTAGNFSETKKMILLK